MNQKVAAVAVCAGMGRKGRADRKPKLGSQTSQVWESGFWVHFFLSYSRALGLPEPWFPRFPPQGNRLDLSCSVNPTGYRMVGKGMPEQVFATCREVISKWHTGLGKLERWLGCSMS